MITATRAGALAAAFVSAAIAGLPTVARAAPCDTRAADVDYLELPFSASELRRAMPAGLEVVVRMESPIAGNFSRRMVVEQVSTEMVMLSEITLEESFRRTMPDSTVDASWEELRDHACFPAEFSERSRVTTDTPFGELSGWRYQFVDGDLRLVTTFADELPGLPVRYERYEADILVLSSAQTERSDRIRVADEVVADETP